MKPTRLLTSSLFTGPLLAAAFLLALPARAEQEGHAEQGTHAKSGTTEKKTAKASGLSDAQMEERAHKGIASKEPSEQQEILKQLQTHRFKSNLAREREFALYAQAVLEDRLGDRGKSVATFRKLERIWPSSIYLSEGQIILATAALDAKRLKDAESRVQKALHADIPVESKRRAQELLLWILCEQERHAEGMEVVKSLYPLPEGENPSERGLVALAETLCVAQEVQQAEGARKDLLSLYPKSPYLARVDLKWAQLLGSTGKTKESAKLLRKIITTSPNSPEADDARLSLATLLSEGKLDAKLAAELPSAQKLLDEIKDSDRKGDKGRRALLVQLKVHMSQSRWKEAIETADQLRVHPTAQDSHAALITQMRCDSLRALAQQLLDAAKVEPLLPYMNEEGFNALQTEQRLSLIKLLAKTGLNAANQTLIRQAPARERESLRQAALEATPAGTQAEDTLALLPGKKESPKESLRHAQALLSLQKWSEARAPLAQATPGAERIAALLTYLRRPLSKTETAKSRRSEAEGWLARCPEKTLDREPLVILVADMRAQDGDWRSALSLYPSAPSADHRGWVALMRATCQARLGQKDAAKATLKASVDLPGFKMERQTLAKSLGM